MLSNINNTIYVKPELEGLKQILTAANQAPSGDNCQPWSFSWENDCLQIKHNKGRAEHLLNSGNYASLISLGALLESIRIAAPVYGYHAETHLTFDKNQTELAWATCKFIAVTKSEESGLFEWIFKRCVDRRVYKKRNPNHPVLKELQTLAEKHQGLKLHLVKKQSLGLCRSIAKAEALVWKDRRSHYGLFHWLRFKTYGDLRDYDGMPWKSLGIKKIQAILLHLCENYIVQRVANLLGFTVQVRLLTLLQLFKSTSLICFTVKSDSPEEIANVGSLAIQVWLRLQRAGFGVQPISVSSLGSFIASHFKEAETDRFFSKTSKSSVNLRKTFNIPKDEFPIWMFRTGPSSELPADCRAKRLPIDIIFNY